MSGSALGELFVVDDACGLGFVVDLAGRTVTVEALLPAVPPILTTEDPAASEILLVIDLVGGGELTLTNLTFTSPTARALNLDNPFQR